ncbi:MAG: Hsp70 family protein [Bacteroidota bacterium]
MTINFGIDLGTTNSAIAKFEKGEVIVFRNPIGQKQTLPSIVSLRKERLLVGEKAREYLLKAPQDVAASFKRKMGTTETYHLGEKTYTPTELSALVLKELKNFIHTGEIPQSTIVTIPASFDTIQSNATKEAGKLAGFEEVVLLQEPIAASLAYANQGNQGEYEEGKWLVYDLGGGTFDVALIQIQDGEMKVLDNQGDNFLGGHDFDREIVEKIVIPYLESQGSFTNLPEQMRASTGKYNQLYHSLLIKAEQAKIELSASESAEIEFDTVDDQGEQVEGFLTVTREQLEALLEPHLVHTLELVGTILDRNKLKPQELKFVLLVGGSTYIPYIRTQIAERLGIPVNTDVDPTTAVTVGAAYYAGTKALRNVSTSSTTEQVASQVDIQVRTAFQKATKENKEYFAARFEGNIEGLTYRITRQDGGYDSGAKVLTHKVSEYLPLIPNSYNEFTLKVYDTYNNPLSLPIPPIGITQGKYAVVGQPLPQDICLEIDDVENQTTALEVIFEKNDVLPLKRTLVKQMSRTISKGSEERLTLTIIEGPGTALPAASQQIGFISVSGKDLNRDLVKGSDVEITLQMSESRDLSISAYLLMTDQEFSDVFQPEARRVNILRLTDELVALAEKVREEAGEAEIQDNYEGAQQLIDLEFEILGLADRTRNMSLEDSTDEKFQLEDRKRKLAQRVDELTRDKYIIRVKNEYFEAKRDIEYVLENYEPTEEDKGALDQLMEQEKSVLATNSSLKIQEFTDQIRRLNFRIRWRSSSYIREFFMALVYGRFGDFIRPNEAQQLITRGYEALENKNDQQLRVIINQLIELLPPSQRGNINFGGTGIV